MTSSDGYDNSTPATGMQCSNPIGATLRGSFPTFLSKNYGDWRSFDPTHHQRAAGTLVI